jgi:hypothetical protein
MENRKKERLKSSQHEMGANYCARLHYKSLSSFSSANTVTDKDR